MKPQKRHKQVHKILHGFTILEVLMVLAIAALITALVFIAVGTAQRSSRDTARRKAATDLSTALEQWIQNNNGQLPVAGTDVGLGAGNVLDATKPFCSQNYLANACANFKDPTTGTVYTFTNQSFSTSAAALGSCTINETTPAQIQVLYANSRNYTIKICLEAGQYTLSP